MKMNGFTIQSISEDGTYYLVKDWRKHKVMWVKKENIKPEYLYASETYAKKGMEKLLNIMTDYATDELSVVYVENGFIHDVRELVVKNEGDNWYPNYKVSPNPNAKEKYEMLSFEEAKALEVGDTVLVGVNFSHMGFRVYYEATVITPLFWNSDADEPDWEVETSHCFADVYSLYKKIK